MVREASGRLLDAVRTLQEGLWRFQGALGRLQEVLEGFWAENIGFPLVFEGFGREGRMDADGGAAGLGPPKPRFLRKSTKANTVKPLNGKALG